MIKDGSENQGRLLVKVDDSAFTSSEIIVDIRDIKSICALGNDNFGEDGNDGNVLRISRYFCNKGGKWVDTPRALTLPGDAFRDRSFLDWILADKSGESELVNDFQDLMIKQHELSTSQGKIGAFDVLAARDEIVSITANQDKVIDAQIKNNDPTVDKVLQQLASMYGSETLKNLSDKEIYSLYKNHSLSSK